MTTPEPLDEWEEVPPPETRGGDRLADITVTPPLDTGVWRLPDDLDVCSCGMPGCELE